MGTGPKKRKLPRDRSNWRKQCNRCNGRFDGAADHFKKCPFRACSTCRRKIAPGIKHICSKKRCSRCQKKNIPQSDFEQHKLQCTFQSNSKRCSRCGRGGFDHTSDHFKTCPFRTCGTCCKSIPPGTTHNCSRKHCFNCNKRNIPAHEFERHKLQCNFKFCINCLGRFPIDVAHDCSKKKCISCLRHYPRQEFAQHYSQCYALFRDRKLALKANAHCIRLRFLRQVACLNPREKDALYCKEHFDEKLAGILYDRKQNTAAEQQFFRKKLLRKTGHSPLWRNPSISAVAQIWRNSPQNVALCDIETSYICNATSHTDIYEVAIMDARGEWIIQPTTIHHRLSKKELACTGRELSDRTRKAQIRKHYGEFDDTEAIGIGGRSATWQEIGQALQSYVDKHGTLQLWLDWSSGNHDYKGVRVGLESVGYEHLLPPQPSGAFRPLLWWRGIRDTLQLHGLKLCQANLYSILYPGDIELALSAHRAGPDVQMLRKVVQYFLHASEGVAIVDRIEKDPMAVNLETVDDDGTDGELDPEWLP